MQSKGHTCLVSLFKEVILILILATLLANLPQVIYLFSATKDYKVERVNLILENFSNYLEARLCS